MNKLTFDEIINLSVSDFFARFKIADRNANRMRRYSKEERQYRTTMKNMQFIGAVVPICYDGLHAWVLPFKNQETPLNVMQENVVISKPIEQKKETKRMAMEKELHRLQIEINKTKGNK